MTSRLVRLYCAALAALGLVAAWLGVASRPAPRNEAAAASAPADPRVAAHAARERRVLRRVAELERLVARSAPPPVQVVDLPPVTRTRSS
jgi:hypothetical protein